ncbi:MAG: Cell division protein FtsL [Chlamydiae bacterium]|nr:Cell division protein FtsL [Chlamydiota bacterium]NGX47435.1 Cell division protein FtsL [Chlamydiota bacterium]
MNKGMFFRIFFCILCLGLCLYSFLDMQNEITQLRIRIPTLMSEVRRIGEENTHYQYEIERFENPENLMKLAKASAFSHLKFPICNEVITMKQADPLQDANEKSTVDLKKQPSITFASSGNP